MNTKIIKSQIQPVIFILFVLFGLIIFYPSNSRIFNSTLPIIYNNKIFTNIVVGGDVIIAQPVIAPQPVARPTPMPTPIIQPTNSSTNVIKITN
jgi:hypothetical protein